MALKSLYCLPTDIKSYAATWSLTSGIAHANFPLTNLNSVYAHLVAKTTGTTATFKAVISSIALQGIAIINCNLAGLTLAITNNGGMPSQNLVIPAAHPDGVSLNGWVDLRAVTTAATDWSIAISGAAANIAIGKILLVGTLRETPIRWGVGVGERKPTRIVRTDDDIALGYRRAVRYRTWTPEFRLESHRAAFTTLRRSSEGPTQPFLFLLDYAVNDPAYVWFPESAWDHTRAAPLISRWSDRLEEANPGVAL